VDPPPTRISLQRPGDRAVTAADSLGGIGSEIARGAYSLGMHLLATDPKALERPLYVEEQGRLDHFHAVLPRADVVANIVPLTKQSHRMIAARELATMRRGVVPINVSRDKVVDTDALVADAALELTAPERLPKGPSTLAAQQDRHAPDAGRLPAATRPLRRRASTIKLSPATMERAGGSS
jgi:hypothetical protein